MDLYTGKTQHHAMNDKHAVMQIEWQSSGTIKLRKMNIENNTVSDVEDLTVTTANSPYNLEYTQIVNVKLSGKFYFFSILSGSTVSIGIWNLETNAFTGWGISNNAGRVFDANETTLIAQDKYGNYWIYENINDTWTYTQMLNLTTEMSGINSYARGIGRTNDLQMQYTKIMIDGDRAIISFSRASSNQGRIFVIEKSGGTWSKTATLTIGGYQLGNYIYLLGGFVAIA